MNKLSLPIEFFAIGSDIYYRAPEGVRQLDEKDTIIRDLADFIRTFYPLAYSALSDEYRAATLNPDYHQFRIVTRFIKCNFSLLDSIPDITADGKCNFEDVPCPLRGECRHEGIICRPTFSQKMTDAEQRVMVLWYRGLSQEEISKLLYLSPFTVQNHIKHAYSRLGVHSRAEFAKFAAENNLFP